MSNLIFYIIFWAVILILCLLVFLQRRQLDRLSDRYCNSQKELNISHDNVVDLAMTIQALKDDNKRYRCACNASDAARKALMDKAGIIPCLECKHFVGLYTDAGENYSCSCKKGLSEIEDPRKCFCGYAERPENEKDVQ